MVPILGSSRETVIQLNFALTVGGMIRELASIRGTRLLWALLEDLFLAGTKDHPRPVHVTWTEVRVRQCGYGKLGQMVFAAALMTTNATLT